MIITHLKLFSDSGDTYEMCQEDGSADGVYRITMMDGKGDHYIAATTEDLEVLVAAAKVLDGEQQRA